MKLIELNKLLKDLWIVRGDRDVFTDDGSEVLGAEFDDSEDDGPAIIIITS